MRILLSFAPFIVFAVAVKLTSLEVACLIPAGIGLASLLRDSVLHGRSVKILEAGSVLLYGGLGLATALLHPGWSMWVVWLINDAGLLLIALGSLAIGLPFTLQYAREQVAPELWDNPVFMSVNLRITAAWACAFAVMLLAKLAVATVPGVPGWVGGMASILASIAAIKFTTWYPAYVRQARIVAEVTPAQIHGA
jgi:hypothetical protein